MVKLLEDHNVAPNRLIWRLNMLWLADGDPGRTYAEAEQRLRTFAKSAPPDLQADVLRFLRSC